MQRVNRKPSDRGSECGFTLVELVVTLLILGILMTIATPVFLGARSRAHDSTAKRMTIRAVKAARILATDTGNFSGVTSATLAETEPEITWLNKGQKSTAGDEVSQDVPDVKKLAQTFVAAAFSESGTCFFVQYSVTGGTEYGTLTNVKSNKCKANGIKNVVLSTTAW